MAPDHAAVKAPIRTPVGAPGRTVVRTVIRIVVGRAQLALVVRAPAQASALQADAQVEGGEIELLRGLRTGHREGDVEGDVAAGFDCRGQLDANRSEWRERAVHELELGRLERERNTARVLDAHTEAQVVTVVPRVHALPCDDHVPLDLGALAQL